MGHEFPILVNNADRVSERRAAIKTKYTSRQLSGKTVVWKLIESEHVAGLVWHVQGENYLIRFTDGTEEQWSYSDVIQRMVGIPGTKSFVFE